MLVLSRKSGERIHIGENITLTIVRIDPNNVRLGIDAPRDLNIVREELCVPATSSVLLEEETQKVATASTPQS
jgi:carbon storage regulator